MDSKMPAEFGETDRKKKEKRAAGVPAGPIDDALKNAIASALVNGCISCPAAFGVAKKLAVPPGQVGAAADALGIRIVNCQLGCFKFEKTGRKELDYIDPAIVGEIETVIVREPLTCTKAFEIARKMKKSVSDVGDVANARNFKIKTCQLGCF